MNPVSLTEICKVLLPVEELWHLLFFTTSAPNEFLI